MTQIGISTLFSQNSFAPICRSFSIYVPEEEIKSFCITNFCIFWLRQLLFLNSMGYQIQCQKLFHWMTSHMAAFRAISSGTVVYQQCIFQLTSSCNELTHLASNLAFLLLCQFLTRGRVSLYQIHAPYPALHLSHRDPALQIPQPHVCITVGLTDMCGLYPIASLV